MNWLGELRRRLQFLFHRKRFEQDLADEMNLHLELRAAENSPAARQRFDNLTQLAETSRGVWGWTFLETLVQDLRYGLRTLAANPGFAATAVLSLLERSGQ
jgi:hypothetical protein